MELGENDLDTKHFSKQGEIIFITVRTHIEFWVAIFPSDAQSTAVGEREVGTRVFPDPLHEWLD